MTTGVAESARISADQVLSIAFRDAETAYRNLDRFRVTISLEQDGWHVDFRLKTPGIYGGGPHYIIDSITGDIAHKRYEQ